MYKATKPAIAQRSFGLPAALLIITAVSMGCAKTVQVYKLPQETQAETAKIYIMRPSPFAYAVNQKVYEDNSIAGQVGPRSFIGWDVEPGPTTLHGPWGFVKVLAQPGKTYYFKLKGKTFGYGNRAFKLVVIPEEEGRAYLEKLKPPKINIIEQPS